MALENEAWREHEAGNYAGANAADLAREKLVPAVLKAEEGVYRADIAANVKAKEELAAYIRGSAGNSSPQDIEELVRGATSNFENEIWRLEQQLADNLQKQSALEIVRNAWCQLNSKSPSTQKETMDDFQRDN